MKKIFMTTLVLLAMLGMTAGTVFAGSALELVDVKNNASGPTFIFRVTGEFSESELNGGFVSVEGGNDYPLYCEQIDADTVVCHTSKKVAGHDVVVGFGGARFWVAVPSQTFCYQAYDWNYTPGGWLFDSEYWSNFARHCQENPAAAGDRIVLFNPEWGASYTYTYYPGGVDAYGWDNPGAGYFYY